MTGEWRGIAADISSFGAFFAALVVGCGGGDGGPACPAAESPGPPVECPEPLPLAPDWHHSVRAFDPLCGHDPAELAAGQVLVDFRSHLVAGKSVLLGREAAGPLATLDSDGIAVFDDAGTGPYSASVLLEDVAAANSWEGAPGPVICWPDPPRDQTYLLTDAPPWSISGRVSGCGSGDRVEVTLLLGGGLWDTIEARDGHFRFEFDDLVLDPPAVARLVATEWKGTSIISIGTAVVSCAVSGGTDESADVVLDASMDGELEVTVSGLDPASGEAHLDYGLLFEGAVFSPNWERDTWIPVQEGTPVRLSVPQALGSLANAGVRIEVRTDGYLNPGLVEGTGQLALFEGSLSAEGAVTVDLLPVPVFRTMVGTDDDPAAHLATGFRVEYDPPAAATDPTELWLHDAAFLEPAWVVHLASDASTFEPFPLPAPMASPNPPTDVPFRIDLIARRVDGATATESTARGVVLLSEGL